LGGCAHIYVNGIVGVATGGREHMQDARPSLPSPSRILGWVRGSVLLVYACLRVHTSLVACPPRRPMCSACNGVATASLLPSAAAQCRLLVQQQQQLLSPWSEVAATHFPEVGSPDRPPARPTLLIQREGFFFFCTWALEWACKSVSAGALIISHGWP